MQDSNEYKRNMRDAVMDGLYSMEEEIDEVFDTWELWFYLDALANGVQRTADRGNDSVLFLVEFHLRLAAREARRAVEVVDP